MPANKYVLINKNKKDNDKDWWQGVMTRWYFNFSKPNVLILFFSKSRVERELWNKSCSEFNPFLRFEFKSFAKSQRTLFQDVGAIKVTEQHFKIQSNRSGNRSGRTTATKFWWAQNTSWSPTWDWLRKKENQKLIRFGENQGEDDDLESFLELE